MSDTIQIGDRAPNIPLPATGGQTLSPTDYQGRKLVLYFYPKDSTPGCTTEGNDFSRLHDRFRAAGAEILGVSRDSVKSHEKFKEKQGFPFELLSDANEELCNALDVIQEKVMFGKRAMGIERSTFLFDADGALVREWRKVKVPEHADEVLAAVEDLG
ncbi:MAG: peroxiredoxin [Pseudomonadota bacterium]